MSDLNHFLLKPADSKIGAKSGKFSEIKLHCTDMSQPPWKWPVELFSASLLWLNKGNFMVGTSLADWMSVELSVGQQKSSFSAFVVL